MVPNIMESIQSRLKQIFYLDLRMLACLRVGLGAITLWDLVSRADSFRAHYGLEGILPPGQATLYADFNALIPLHLWFTSDFEQACLFVVHGLTAMALILGIKTRWATIISWVFINSLHIRNPMVLYGADRELAALFFWAMFLPLGARWSLDMTQRLEWQGKVRIEGWLCTGFILQVALIYFTSAWSKSGESWSDGTAVWLALNIDTYTSDFGRILLSSPALLSALTYTTLIAEWIAPLLLLAGPCVPLRQLGCWILISLQLGLLIFMDLGLFPLVSIIALIAITPTRKAPLNDESRDHIPPNLLMLQFAAAFFVSLMLIWQIMLIPNAFSSNSVLAKMPEPLQWLLKTTRLAQSWSMFSPDPPDSDGWFILEYQGGPKNNAVDLLKPTKPLSWEKPSSQKDMLDSDRWKEWFHKTHSRGLSWKQTMRYFQEHYATSSPADITETRTHLLLWFIEESALSPERAPKRHLLTRHSQAPSGSDR